MDVVWVWGELIVHRYRSDWGISGYQMLARGTVPYRESHTR
jgi:hypothetical protein